MSLESYDYTNITFDICKEFGRVETDAFKNDLLVKAFFKPEERLNDESLPPIADFEKLRDRVNLFERLALYSARKRYIRVKSDPRHKVYLLKDEGRYVAGAHWVLPKYLPAPSVSIFQRFKNFFVSYWFKLLDFISFLGTRNPILESGILNEFKFASKELSANATEERLNELHNLSLKQQKETAYPKDYSYYLELLAVRTTGHGKGYGKKIVNGTLEALGPYVAPSSLVGPAKATLISAPTARGFYASLGFSIGASLDHMLPNGELVNHTYFFKNLPSEHHFEDESV